MSCKISSPGLQRKALLLGDKARIPGTRLVSRAPLQMPLTLPTCQSGTAPATQWTKGGIGHRDVIRSRPGKPIWWANYLMCNPQLYFFWSIFPFMCFEIGVMLRLVPMSKCQLQHTGFHTDRERINRWHIHTSSRSHHSPPTTTDFRLKLNSLSLSVSTHLLG